MLVVPAVFGLAILEIWAAVPTGIALGVPPLAVWLLTVTGSLVGVAVVALGGGSLRACSAAGAGTSPCPGAGDFTESGSAMACLAGAFFRRSSWLR